MIKTDTAHHYISTAWIEALGYYETMVFRRRPHDEFEDEIDWATVRADEENEAILNHCLTIQQIIAMEGAVLERFG